MVERSGFQSWWVLSVLSTLYIISIIDRYVISMLVPYIKASLHLTDGQMGIILGPAFSVFYAVFGIPLGWAADKYSRRWVIFIGSVLFGCATVGSALAGSFAALFLARACVAIGEASLSPAAYSLIAEKFPRHLVTTASSIYNSATKVGNAAAFAIGGVALGIAADIDSFVPALRSLDPWRIVFLLTGIPAIVISLLVFTFGEKKRQIVRTDIPGASLNAIWPYMVAKRRLMAPLLIGFASAGICAAALATWVPTYLTRHYHLDPAHFGPVLALISLVSASTLVVKGAIVDWLYARGTKDIHVRFYTWLLAGALPVAMAMFFIHDATLFMIMYGIVQVVALTLVVYLAAALQLVVPPHLKGRVISVFLFAYSVFGLGSGPMIVGFLTDYVFGDDKLIGWSLATVAWTTLPLALISLRHALKPLHAEMCAREAEALADTRQ